jgi:hypothetical protein
MSSQINILYDNSLDNNSVDDNSSHHCSFCGNTGHDIRFCDSPNIPDIEHTIANLYVSNLQESMDLQLNEDETEAQFINTLFHQFLLRNIRVLAVTSGLATASGYTKAEYCRVIYRHYHQTFQSLIDVINFVNNNNIVNNNNNNYVRDLLEEFNQVFINNFNSESGLESELESGLESGLESELESVTNSKFNITPVLNIDILNAEDAECECECGICLESNIALKQMVKLNCEHSFCSGCIVRVLETTSVDKVPTCAFCRASITDIETNCVEVYGAISEFCNISG